uniref:Uncharacterized protein n=1 Tax=Arundo donax TaxID=35708 RepID=A0A0A9G9N1_ARUDO
MQAVDEAAITVDCETVTRWSGEGPVRRKLPQTSNGVDAVVVLEHDEQAAIAAVANETRGQHGCKGTAGGDGELLGLREWEKTFPAADFYNEDAEDAGRVERAEATEEGGVGDAAEPAPADERGVNQEGREVEAEDDLHEEVIVAKNQHDRGRRRGFGGLPVTLPLHPLHAGPPAVCRWLSQGPVDRSMLRLWTSKVYYVAKLRGI